MNRDAVKTDEIAAHSAVVVLGDEAAVRHVPTHLLDGGWRWPVEGVEPDAQVEYCEEHCCWRWIALGARADGFAPTYRRACQRAEAAAEHEHTERCREARERYEQTRAEREAEQAARRSLDDVLSEVAAERARQDARFGEQNWPAVLPFGYRLGSAEWYRINLARMLSIGTLSYTDILLEEVAEAIEAPDGEERERELIQVAAVAVAMVQASRRARAGGAR